MAGSSNTKQELRWLKGSDVMLVLEINDDVKSKIDFANEHNIPVCYSLEDLRNLEKTSDD